MTTQTSRLEIIIDTDRAKKGTDDTVKSLSNLEKQGDKTQKQAKDTAKSIEDVGKSSQDASPKIKKIATDVKSTGDEAKTASSKFTDLKNSIVSASNDGKFGGFSQKITSGLSGMSSGAVLAGVALGGAVVAGVGLAVASLSTMAIEIAKSNVELAQFSSIANTTVEKFQGLSGAALTFGITQEKLSDQLKDFNEKIGEFNSIGGGGAVDFFEQIAIKTEKGADGAKKLAEEMSKMDGIDALQTYVNKLEEVGVNQKEMSFYLESMGSDLTALAPLLMNGGQLWKDYQEALEDAGIITGQDAIETSIALASQTESLQMQYQALKSELAMQLMPILSSLLTFFMDGSNEGNRFSGVISAIGVTAQAVGVIVIGLATGIQNLVSIMSFAINQLKTIGNTAVNFAAADGIKAKGSALLGGAKDLLYGNTVKMSKEIYQNSSNGFKGIGNIVQSQSGQYDKLTQSIINNRKAQLEWNKTQKSGLGGGAQQNKKLFPTAKAAKTPKAKVDNTAQREAERLKREAEREQREIERLKERITKEYATKEQRLLIQYEEAKADIQKGFVNDPTSRDLYLAKAKDVYDKEVTDYKKAQQEKFNSFKRDFADKVYSSQTNLGLMALESQYGRDSFQYKSASLIANTDADKRSATESFNDDTKKIEAEYDTPERAGERYALLEEVKRAHVMRMQEIDTQHHVASRELIEQQKLMQLQAFSSLTGSMMGLVDESSSAYQALFAMQKGMNFAQALMNGYTAISAAWASAPFPYNMGAVALATVESGVLQSAIQAVTPRFATGGHVRGAGTGTSDSIDAKLSNGEFVMTAEATKRIGVDKLDAANKGSSIENTNVVASQPNINLNPSFVIVDERQNIGDYLFSSDGTKAFVKFFNRNKTALGF